MIINVISLFGSIIFLIISLISLLIYYKKESNQKYSFKNCFPYELNHKSSNNFIIIGKIIMIVSWFFLTIFYIVFPIHRDKLGNLQILVSFTNVVGIIGIILVATIFIIDTKNVKKHLIIDVLFFTITFVLTGSVSFMGFWTLLESPSSNIDIKKIVCSSFACLLLILQILLIFNPKLKNWHKLDKQYQDDQSVIYIRPKWFVLAYSEWSFIFSIYIDAILLFVMFA